jgi:hypothetical protein
MSPHTASLAPQHQFDVTVHIVLDSFGTAGCAYRETAEEGCRLRYRGRRSHDRKQFNNPVRVIAFNTSEGWSRDVSEQVAWNWLSGSRKETKRLPAQHVDSSNFISAKRN